MTSQLKIIFQKLQFLKEEWHFVLKKEASTRFATLQIIHLFTTYNDVMIAHWL